MITSSWTLISDSKEPSSAFTNDQYNYPKGFVSIYIICLDTSDIQEGSSVPYFLLMDGK